MNHSHHRDPDLVVAEQTMGCLGALLFGGALVFMHLFREANRPVYPGVVLGHRRAGFQQPVTLPWSTFCHVWLKGATGSGKSTLLQHIAIQYIKAGYGITVISPKADLIEDLLPHIPLERVDDVILFDATDTIRPLAFNVLEEVDPQLRSRAASEVLTIFKRFYADAWGTRMEHILRFTLLALLEYPGATLATISPFLLDDAFRTQVLARVTNPAVTQFWRMEYAAMSTSLRSQAIQPILNKTASIMVYPQVSNILAYPHSSFRFNEMMDQSRILFVNLPQGRLGEDVTSFLGGLLVSKQQLAATSRASLPPARRRRHLLLIDEFQNFGGDDTFVKIFTEARAFNLALVCVNQYDAQLSSSLRAAIEHNVGVSLHCQVEQGVHTVFYRQPQDPSHQEEVLIPLPPLGRGNPVIAWRIREQSRVRYGRILRPHNQLTAQHMPRRNSHAQPNHIAFFQAPHAKQAYRHPARSGQTNE